MKMITKMCDLCNKTIAANEMVRIPAREMQQAIREGFNPYKTPGIDMSVSEQIALRLGIGRSPEEVFQVWRQKVMADAGDWGLCPACADAFRRWRHKEVTIQAQAAPGRIQGRLSDFYFWSFLVSWGLILIIVTAAWLAKRPDWRALLLFPLLYGLAVFLALLYRAWKPIQWEGARTKPGSQHGIRITPRRAVGFLFIPFWNIYWFFEVTYGWARNYNAYLRHNQIKLPPVSEKLFLFFRCWDMLLVLLLTFPTNSLDFGFV
jgi:hypothetical protein